MGQADVNVNLWLKDTKRFADLFNAILFQGKAVILPENLHPSPETTAVSLQDAQGKNIVKKQYRDIIMNWQDQALLMLLAVESQTAIHYAAPLKVMLYDSMEYAEQVRVKWKERPPRLSSAEFLSRFQKNDKLIPVITLIFYYGTEEWDGPLELHQMFDLGTEKKHAELMKKYLPNYHINLVDVRRLKNLESFQSDLQIIFGMLQCSQDKYALRTYVANHKDYFQKLDLETYHAIGAFLNSRQLMEISVEKNEMEELDMCKALEDIYNDGVQAGIQTGIQTGIEQGRQSGIAEGEAHGKELGIAEGKASHKKEVARQMQKLGYSLDAIAAVLRESVDGISKILAVVG